MPDQYKGFDIPEIMWDESVDAYYIICDEGEFDGFSERAVLDKWKLRVDHAHWIGAIKEGYREISEFVLGCPDCGALVWEPSIHRKYHLDLTK